MDSMDLDVEMDLDVDLVPDEPIIPEPDVLDTSRSRSPGEIDDNPDALAPTKIHIRGLDILNPNQVKAYVAEHHPEDPVEKIEWIDDSSANLVFASEPAASQALACLVAGSTRDINQLSPRTLLPAKPFSQNPEVILQVRPALFSDRKQAGAASRSRFYLLNPEYDPEERRRRNEARRYRDRGGDNDPRRRSKQRNSYDSGEQFDVSLYDDDEATLASRAAKSRPRRRRSYTPDSDRDERRTSYWNENRGKELFPGGDKRGGSSRGRSASPARDRDGDRSIDGFASDGSGVRDRDRNRQSARAIKSRLSRGNQTRELFPDSQSSGSGRLGDSTEDAATLLAKGITLPLMDGSNDAPPTQSRRLEDRISPPGSGRLADRITGPGGTTEAAFNIRGTANRRSSHQGFAIKGVAGKSAKELFPDKFGSNAGKELFADGLEGRSRRRQRAGDLFD
ncbi:hypothetical protein F5X96DRAFT_681161 [Biscogniauxia mediterranea]|nr:hypothetical protein F5X96DRAFT_681161 [Biscogniauxia mediterranea]